jgi:hypothetical protein
MNKEQHKPDERLNNVEEKNDASSNKHAPKLIEVKKKDTSEDKDNEFLVHEKPFDEQMHESFTDLRNDLMDEEGD